MSMLVDDPAKRTWSQAMLAVAEARRLSDNAMIAWFAGVLPLADYVATREAVTLAMDHETECFDDVYDLIATRELEEAYDRLDEMHAAIARAQ